MIDEATPLSARDRAAKEGFDGVRQVRIEVSAVDDDLVVVHEATPCLDLSLPSTRPLEESAKVRSSPRATVAPVAPVAPHVVRVGR